MDNYGNVERAFFTSIDDNQDFTIYKSSLIVSGQSKISVLWNLFKELDENCRSVAEVEIYIKYFSAKKNADKNELTLNDYKVQLVEKDKIINQYQDVLEGIREMIAENAKISKN